MSYSRDLRERAVSAYLDGEGTYEEVGARFKVHRDTVYRWVLLQKRTGDLAPQTQNNRRPFKLTDDQQQLLRQMLHNAPDAHDHVIADALNQATNVTLHPSTIGDYARRWGITRKKRPSSLPSRTPTASKP